MGRGARPNRFRSDPAAGAWHGDCEIKIWEIARVARCAWQGRHAAKDRRDAVEGGSRGDPRHQGAGVSCSAKTSSDSRLASSSRRISTTYRTILNTCGRNISRALEKSDGGRRAAHEAAKLGAALELRSSAAPRIGALQGTASLSFKSTGTLGDSAALAGSTGASLAPDGRILAVGRTHSGVGRTHSGAAGARSRRKPAALPARSAATKADSRAAGQARNPRARN